MTERYFTNDFVPVGSVDKPPGLQAFGVPHGLVEQFVSPYVLPIRVTFFMLSGLKLKAEPSVYRMM